jgi:hypothetical protein
MMLALATIALTATGSAAQTLDCALDVVCSPVVGCEALDGVPFQLERDANGRFTLGDDNGAVSASVSTRTGDSPLMLVFQTPARSVLVTLAASGALAVSEHREGPGTTMEVATFTGSCGGNL